jgi:hypothetical protein
MSTIDIKELVKPKFQPGQRVWYVRRDYNQRVEMIAPVTVARVDYVVQIARMNDEEVRIDATIYHCGTQTYGDKELIASLDELQPNERAA